MSLAAGGHGIVVDYLEYGGGETLEVRWSGPGTPQQAIPAAS